MHIQTYVLCPHCAGTGVSHLAGGPAPCIACVPVRVVPVHTLVHGAQALARELGRARVRLAALEVKLETIPPEPPPRRGPLTPIVPLAEPTPEELEEQARELRAWQERNGRGEGA